MNARAFGPSPTPLALMALAMALAIEVQPVVGQSLWSQASSGRTVGLEIAKPFFDGGNDGWSALSSASFLSIQWPLSGRIAFLGELPLAYGSYDAGPEGWRVDSELIVGNPYLGVMIQASNPALSWQVGLRLPLVSNEEGVSATVGALSDYVGRTGAFVEETVPVTGMVAYRKVKGNGLLLGLTGGVENFIPTGEHGNVETVALYAGQAGYSGTHWSLTGGVGGLMWLTQGGLNLSERTVHDLAITLGYHHSRIEPTIFVRTPVDGDFGDIVDTVVGIGVRAHF